MRSFEKFTLAFGVPLVFALSLCFFMNLEETYNESYANFYGSNRLTSAPDGIYSVWVCDVELPNETFSKIVEQLEQQNINYSLIGIVWFPLCPSYGGTLHGAWLYEFESVSFVEHKWYDVWLMNNVVVCAKEWHYVTFEEGAVIG